MGIERYLTLNIEITMQGTIMEINGKSDTSHQTKYIFVRLQILKISTLDTHYLILKLLKYVSGPIVTDVFWSYLFSYRSSLVWNQTI